jgi:hypothetical protein
MVWKSLDKIVNFAPKGIAKLIAKPGNGKGGDGLIYLPIAIAGYLGVCGMQGALAAYGAYSMGAGVKTTLATGIAATLAPPLVWMGRIILAKDSEKFDD